MPTRAYPDPRSARGVVMVTAAVGTALTLLVSVLPFVDFAYRGEGTHVAIETAASIIALLAAIIVMGRFVRSHARSDLLLSGALLLLAASNFVFSAIPSTLSAEASSFEVWSTLIARVLSAVALAAAAFAPDRPIPRPRLMLLRTVGATVGLLAAVALLVALLEPLLPAAVDPQLSPESSARPRLVGPASVLVLQLVIVLVYAAATIGFVRRVERTGDELMLWFAVAATIAAVSRLNYFLFPSLYSEWVYTGDVFRLLFYLLLFGGAIREIAGYQRRLAAGAVLEERRRIARDLHDGLAQELAFITSQVRRLEGSENGEVVEMIAHAADRAHEESRTAIAALIQPANGPFESSLAHAAAEVAERALGRVHLELAPDLAPPAEIQEALIRVVREAVGNAVRHGEAENVWVSIANEGGLTLTVSDDGVGFSGQAKGTGGFGLLSMRERIEALNGTFALRSTPGEGTAVKVTLP